VAASNPPKHARFLFFGPVIGSNDRLRFGQIKQALGQFKLTAAGRAAASWVEEEGWRFSPKRLAQRAEDEKAEREFDELYGVNTFQEGINGADVTGDNFDGRYHYLASTVAKFRRMLDQLRVRYEDFTFIDLGSGKGRTILLAGERPFRRVIGVEYSHAYHAIALQNIKKYPLKKAGSLESVTNDVATYEFPAGNLIVYNYNSFAEPVLTRVLENINRAAREQPRQIYMVFLNLGYINLPDEESNLAYGEQLLKRHNLVLRRVFEKYRLYEWVA